MTDENNQHNSDTNVADVAIIMMDPSGSIQRWNAGAERILGWSEAEVLGRSADILFTPEDIERDQARAERRDALARGLAVSTRWYVRKDGSRFWASSEAYPIADQHGSQIGFLKVLRDRTSERLEAEVTLSMKERSVSALGLGMVITDAQHPDGPIIYMNDAFGRLTGYNEREVLGRNCRFLQGQGTDREAISRIKSAVARGEGITETLTNYRKDGSAFVNELIISPVRDSSGLVTHFVGIQLDVTGRVETEAQLRQAQKMEAVGQLTGGVAHDFNNLLTVILGNAELLAEEPVDREQTREMAEMILGAAERGADLTNNLLAFGRRQPMKAETFSISDVISGMQSLLRRTLGEQIAIKINASEVPARAMVDRTLLESAVLNLSVNARDAMAAGGTLTIIAGERLAAADDLPLPEGIPVVFVTVSDTGSGMPPDVLARVFEPFFTTKDVGKGTGLGLAMVHGFAEQAGGRIAIESQMGKGTSVTIVLPAASAEATEDSREARWDYDATPGGERVLVVEDEPPVREFISSQLRGLGYTVTAVGSGQEALQALSQDKGFDLVFTDVVLPHGMSGLELASHARRIQPRTKVVLTSGYPADVLTRYGYPDTNIPLLRKPFRRGELLDTFRKVLKA